jgi:glycosyltransferase involved in cell wall biosynthesis
MTARRPTAPFFSVLIAAHNAAQYVTEALDSVSAQTCEDYEIVVVDDGSTDGTRRLLVEWADAFKAKAGCRVELVCTPNRGQSAALEIGYGACRGQYIALLDADDRWLPQKLARSQEALISRPRSGLAVHPLYVIRSDGQRTGAVRPKAARLSNGDVRAEARRTGRVVVGGSTAMVIETEVFRSLLPFPTNRFAFGADAYLALGACLATPVVAILEALGEYRLHLGGQYIRRMLTRTGLAASVEFQETLARHFGIGDARRWNSNWLRNAFALRRLDGGAGIPSREYWELLAATLTDPVFRVTQRVALAAFWTLCAVTPPLEFERLWRWFQYRQTGYDEVAEMKAHG